MMVNGEVETDSRNQVLNVETGRFINTDCALISVMTLNVEV